MRECWRAAAWMNGVSWYLKPCSLCNTRTGGMKLQNRVPRGGGRKSTRPDDKLGMNNIVKGVTRFVVLANGTHMVSLAGWLAAASCRVLLHRIVIMAGNLIRRRRRRRRRRSGWRIA